MAEQTLYLNNFSGGLSDDNKFGPQNSFAEGEAIDARQSPALLTPTKQLTKESGSTIITEIFDAVRVNTGDVYLAGKTKIYKRVAGSNGAAGTYSVVTSAVVTACRDLDYRPDIDVLFLYEANGIGAITSVTGTPFYAVNPDKFLYNRVSHNTNSGSSALLDNGLIETHLIPWTATQEPLAYIGLTINSKGSGNWTITVHDGNNSVIATVTVLNAALPSSGATTFVFASPVRLKIGADYHFHVFDSNGSGHIQTDSTGLLANAQWDIYCYNLVDTGDYGHRTIQYGAKTYFCNERYLGEWEILSLDMSTGTAAGLVPQKLVFPAEIVTIGLDIFNEYLAIAGAIKRSTDSLDASPTQGIIFFWDGASDVYNFSLPVPHGAPNSLFSTGGTIYWEARGRWYKWSGGTADDITEVYEFPGVSSFTPAAGGPATDLYTKAGRKVMDMHDGIIKLGYPYATANTNLKVGVFGYGRKKSFLPQVVSYDHLLSTGHDTEQFDTSTNPDTPITGITLLKLFGSNLLVAWKDYISGAVTYGVDYLNDSAAPSASGSWASLWFDNATPGKEKSPLAIKVVFREALPTGATVTPKIRFDRASAWILGTPATATNNEIVFSQFGLTRFYEAQLGFDYTSGATPPNVVSYAFKYDDNEEDTNDIEVAR